MLVLIYLHCHMVDDALPSGRSLQEIVDLPLKSGSSRTPSLCLYVAASGFAPFRWATVQIQSDQRYGVQRLGN